MAIQTIFDSVEDVPEVLKDHYAEKDGKWVLQVDKVENIATGLARSKEEILREKKRIEQDFQNLRAKFGNKTDEEILAIIEAAEKKTEPEPKGDIAEILKRKDDEFQKVLATRDKTSLELQNENKDLKQQIENLAVTGQVEKAALAAGINPKHVHRVISETRNNFRRNENNAIEVLDGDGYPTGKTPEAFFKEVYSANEDNLIFYLPTGAGGSGATNGTKPGKRGVDYSKLSANERLKLARQQT
jgi:hypothetical protein